MNPARCFSRASIQPILIKRFIPLANGIPRESRNDVDDASKAAFDPRAFGDIYCPSKGEGEAALTTSRGPCTKTDWRSASQVHTSALVATVPSRSAAVRAPIHALAGHFRAPFQELQSGNRAIIAMILQQQSID